MRDSEYGQFYIKQIVGDHDNLIELHHDSGLVDKFFAPLVNLQLLVDKADDYSMHRLYNRVNVNSRWSLFGSTEFVIRALFLSASGTAMATIEWEEDGSDVTSIESKSVDWIVNNAYFVR